MKQNAQEDSQQSTLLMNRKKEKIKYIYEEIREDEQEPQKFVGSIDEQYTPSADGKPTFGVMTYDVSITSN